MSPNSSNLFAVCHFDSLSKAQEAIADLKQIGVESSSVQTISAESLTGSAASQVQQQFLTAGVHQDDASYLQQELREKGGVLAIVKTDTSNEKQVDQIFARYGAHETDEYQGTETATRAVGQTAATSDNPGSIKVIEEELLVAKRAVVRGGLRIYSHVVETPVEQKISLREETVHVERHKVDRPITTAEVDALAQGQVLEVATQAEEAVVSKRARVVEEVSIGKEASDHTEVVRDTVRKTDVKVEKIQSDVAPTTTKAKGK